MKKFIVSFTFLVLIACSNSTSEVEIGRLIVPSDKQPIKISVQVDEDASSPSLINLLDSIRILKLSNERLIAEITKVKFHGDQVFVFDQIAQALLIFLETGELVNVIDRTGRGPGEFVKIADFAIDPAQEEIVILDQFNRKMLHYDLQGNFINEIRFTTHARHFSIINGAYILYNDFNSRWGETNYNLFISDSSGHVKSHLLPFDKEYKNTNRVKLSYLTDNQAEVNYIGHYSRDWYKITEDSIWKAYEIDFGELNAPTNIVHDRFDAFNEYAHGICYFFENENYLAFSFFYKNQIQTKYYDKKRRAIINGLTSIPHVVYYNFALPVKATWEEYFVQVVDAQQYLDLVKKYNHLELDNPELLPISNTINELKHDDNPVLILFKLKSE